MLKKKLLTFFLIICLLFSFIFLYNHYHNKTSSKTSKNIPQKKIYKKIKKPTYHTDHNLIVVNKKHPLTKNYNPFNGKLNDNNSNGSGLSPNANKAKEKIITDLKNAGFPISNKISGYRSFQYQTILYNNYVANHGLKEADTFSARPGYSEHQTGLAFDLTGENGQLPTDDKLYTWLQNNAYKYGLIIRFPRNSSMITGYIGEEWHLRYIGINNATIMHQKNIKTLEEYTGISGGDYNENKDKDQPAIKE